MDIFQTIILALIQGITEFLPVSSSAHLILPKEILAWPDQGLAFDVAVHVGTLCAVMWYFRTDIALLSRGFFRSIAGVKSNDGCLAWSIIIATIPAACIGLLANDYIEQNLRSISVIAATTIIFGLLLWWADAKRGGVGTLAGMTFKLAFIIGVAQALAMIPGTSRSGITITAALILGFSREDSARFSFLLSIPIILLSGGYMGLKLIGEASVDWGNILVGMVVSGISAYICIYCFLGVISKIGMLPFVVYRLLLGGALITMVVAL